MYVITCSSVIMTYFLCNYGQVERRNNQQRPLALSFWMVHLNLCSLMKIKRETGCLWEMFHGGMQLI